MEPLRLGDDGESFAEKQSRFSLTKSSKQTGDSWEASQSCIRYLVLCNKWVQAVAENNKHRFC